MKFTLSWLHTYLDTSASLEEISDTLTAIGLEVEEIIDNAATYSPFTVAYVEAAEKHPDADKLQICTVKTASGTQQIVCGAPNARAGMKGIFAPEGTYIPGLDVTLKKASIRGVESCGMLVSEKEMELSDEHKGIIEVDDAYEVGTPMAEVFGLDDPVIDIALTPNRADCAGVYGISRDLAAAGLGSLKALDIVPVDGDFQSSIGLRIENDGGCPEFLGREIKGIKNGASPDWMQKQLKAIGLRPISALVDITNYITIAHARPLHVYDVKKLSGDIVVGAANGGESLEALNDKSYELTADAVTINDDSGVIGLGGIIGGTSTGVDESTGSVFLECAYFDPARIARTGRDLGVSSDARYRFERGVDLEGLKQGMDLFTNLVLEICGGEASEIITVGEAPKWQREIDYDPAYVEQLIGVSVSADRQKEILEALGFHVSVDSNFTVHPPSWRGDVFGRADIVEEIIRIVGFDDIPNISVTSETSMPEPAETPLLAKSRAARAAMAARGLQECVTWSFLSRDEAMAFGANDNAIAALTLQNAISNEMNVMRPSILPNLIAAAGRNAARGFGDIALCEVGPVFHSPKPEGQAILAAGIRSGANATRNWADDKASRNVDLYDAKADCLAALEAAGAPAASAQVTRDAAEYFHPGRSGAIRLGKNILAQFGEIHPSVLEELDVKDPVVGFEIFLENIPKPKRKGTEKQFLTLPPLQALSRDFAFLVNEAVGAKDIVKSAMAADKKLISDASVFDVYTGKGVEDGKKSVALNVTIQPTTESLKDEQIDAIMQAVIELVEKKTGGVLRG